MKIESGLEGVEESLKALAAFVNAVDNSMEDALKYILIEMCKYAKENAPFHDQTGNLRNSISVNMDTMREYAAGEIPATDGEIPVLKVEGDGYVGCISAGMEYAIWVELKDGYWILSGSIDHFEPLIEKYLADKMSIDKLDLEEVASVAYLKYQTNQQFGR